MADKLIELFAEGLGAGADTLDGGDQPLRTPPSGTRSAAMNMVTLIEDTFDVRLKTKDIMRMQTIGIARTVLSRKGVEGL